jgi:hypothetical protein
MRSVLTQNQVSIIIENYFVLRDSPANFIYYEVDHDGVFVGCVVDHDYAVELPIVEGAPHAQ